jgi:hypothetical protein
MLGGVVDTALGVAHESPNEEQSTMAPLPCLRICYSSNFMQLHTTGD